MAIIGSGLMAKAHTMAWRNVQAVYGDVPVTPRHAIVRARKVPGLVVSREGSGTLRENPLSSTPNRWAQVARLHEPSMPRARQLGDSVVVLPMTVIVTSKLRSSRAMLAHREPYHLSDSLAARSRSFTTRMNGFRAGHSLLDYRGLSLMSRWASATLLAPSDLSRPWIWDTRPADVALCLTVSRSIWRLS
jgi:hypothetical protein